MDDEQNFLDGMRRMLRTQDGTWSMDFVTNAYAAFDQICKTGYDSVISDIRMPCMDGFELLEKIRSTEWTKDIPVLILTGSSENHLKQRALDLGATDLLNKPVNKEDIIARINSMLRLKSYQDEITAQNILLERKVRERTLELEESRLDIIWRLAKMAEFRDYDTGNHIVRVGYYCRVIAEAIGLEQKFIETLFMTSPLHDIGKIGIPDNILLKPGKLSPEEFEIMKKHCTIGAEMLQHDCKCKDALLSERGLHIHTTTSDGINPLLKMASTIALSHHERWDGTGYPSGLEGDKIPMESRIVALADVYDALCSVRPYKPAFTEEESLAIISDKAGKYFDPVVYEAFLKSIDKLRSIRIKFSDKIFYHLDNDLLLDQKDLHM